VLLLATLTAPFYALGMYLGTRMFGLTSERLFRRICLVLIAAAALVSLPVFDTLMR
jgi:uncharacterized membrane protein YfcA